MAVDVQALEGSARPDGHAGDRIFGDVRGDTGLPREQRVEIPQQRPSTGQEHPAIGDVGGQLRRSLLGPSSSTPIRRFYWTFVSGVPSSMPSTRRRLMR